VTIPALWTVEKPRRAFRGETWGWWTQRVYQDCDEGAIVTIRAETRRECARLASRVVEGEKPRKKAT
jgi:hypothetical protein